MLSKYASRSFMKYVLVGLSNAIFTTIIYLLLLKVFHVPYTVAFTVSWLMGLFFTYVINFVWVFKPERKLEFKRRLWKYALVYVASYLVNIMLLRLVVEHYQIDPFIAQLFIIPLVIAINYSGMKFWALKGSK